MHFGHLITRTCFSSFLFAHYIPKHESQQSTCLYIGRLEINGENSACLLNGQITETTDLVSDLEEADKTIFTYGSRHHEVRNERFLFASSDANSFVCSVYFYAQKFNNKSLTDLFILCGGTIAAIIYTRALKLVDYLHESFMGILPAVHALSRCDKTRKFSTSTLL